MSRMKELALLAAKALDDGCDPFSGEFLTEHNVKSGECIDLSQRMATAIRAFEALPPSEQAIAIAAAELPPEIAQSFADNVRFKESFKRLQKVRRG